MGFEFQQPARGPARLACILALVAATAVGAPSEAEMKRYVLTGAPGSGKTILIRALEMNGFLVVEEAATSLIALEQGQALGSLLPARNDPFFLLRTCQLNLTLKCERAALHP